MTRPQFPTLDASIESDVCIIGGGLTGLLTAYLVHAQGKRVVVLEQSEIGSGATQYTTGFLTQSVDTDYKDLLKMFGYAGTQVVLDSHKAAIDLIEKIAAEEHIECEFTRCDNVSYAVDDSEAKDLKEEFKTLESLRAPVEYSDAPNLPFNARATLTFKHQGKYHALKFLCGLAEVLKKNGVQIFTNAEATDISTKEPVHVETEGGTRVNARWIISAAYSPFKEPLGLFPKKGMYISYLYELEAEKGKLPEGTYEDMDNPYHYFRVDPKGSHDRIVVGGEDHRREIPVSEQKQYAAMDEYVNETFGFLNYRVVRKWTGPVLEPIDGLAFIGPHGHPHTLYAFGFSGNGMTYAGIAAMIFNDIVNGRYNEWAKVYEAVRIPNATSLAIKTRDYGGELIGGAVENAFKREKKE